MESLCVINGKVVWSITIEIALLNNAGNLTDACYLSSLLGLLNFWKPFVKIEKKNEIRVFLAM